MMAPKLFNDTVILLMSCEGYHRAYIKGWDHDPADLLELVAYLEDEEYILDPGDLTVRKCYGAKLQTGTSRDEDWAYEFRMFDKPGCGRFKCVVMEYFR